MAGPVKGLKRPLPAVLGLLLDQSFTFPLRGRTANTHDLSRQLSKGSREQASERNGPQLTGLDVDSVREVTGAGAGGSYRSLCQLRVTPMGCMEKGSAPGALSAVTD